MNLIKFVLLHLLGDLLVIVLFLAILMCLAHHIVALVLLNAVSYQVSRLSIKDVGVVV
jgi:hypothetical protein